MSIIIKGMDMPKGENIRLSWETRYATNITIHLEPIKQEDIIEIPSPHGRLIDADALKETAEIMEYKDWDYTTRYASMVDVENINNAPTILEAEE